MLQSIHRFTCKGFLHLIKSLNKRNFAVQPTFLFQALVCMKKRVKRSQSDSQAFLRRKSDSNTSSRSFSHDLSKVSASLAEGPLSGLCKAAAIEYPEFRIRLLSFDSEANVKQSVDLFVFGAFS